MILIGTGIGDEGGFAPPVHDAIETFGLLQRAVAAAGHESVVRFGLDPASSEFFRHGHYDLGFKDPESKQELLTGQKLGDIYRELAEKFPWYCWRIPLPRMTGNLGKVISNNTRMRVTSSSW